MDKNDSFMYKRPHYYRGQLLDENDFREGFKFHTDAQQHHNLKLHGWGVVSGLEVTRKTANSITIKPGYAIENSGQEVFLKESKEVDLANFGPNDFLAVYLKHADAGDLEGVDTSKQKRLDVYAQISLSRGIGEGTGVILATVKLDDQGEIGKDAISDDHTKYVRVIAHGWIKSDDLHESLKTGWLRMQFRPLPMSEWQKLQTGIPPFRVGRTSALSWDSKDKGDEDSGAQGTMEIPVPPGVTQIKRLRIAGEENQGEILLNLYKAGWDEKDKKHYKDMIIDRTITGAPGESYSKIFDIEGKKKRAIHPEFHTLSLELRGTKRTRVSLIAVEFGYHQE